MKFRLEDITLVDIILTDYYFSDDYNNKLSKLECLFKQKDTGAPDYKTIQVLLVEELEGEGYREVVKTFKKMFTDFHNKTRKNASQSIESRSKGNKLLARKNHNGVIHEEIWKLYSKSIAMAPLNSEELALGYGNRSYLLLHFNEHEECIKDIDRALSVTKSDVLKVKLLCRKMTCLVALKRTDEKNDAWSEIESQLDTMDKELIDDNISKIIKRAKANRLCNESNISKKKMETLSSFTSDAIYLKSNANEEKFLVASRDIKPGEIIMVLKPFVTTINANKLFAYCSYCFSKTWSSIPCDYCNLDMFCSEACKISSWKDYHQYECKVNPLLMITNNSFASQAKLSLRAVCIAIKDAGSISKLREKFEKSDKLDGNPENFLKDGNCCNDFLNVFNLSNLCRLKIIAYFIKYTTVLLTGFIHKNNFFERNLKLVEGQELAKDKDVIFIGVLLLKLLMITCTNAEIVLSSGNMCKKYQSQADCRENFCCIKGSHLTPMANFFKKNCDPNVMKCSTADGKLIYYCFQPIKKNDLLSFAFSGQFFNNPKVKRQKCKCQACQENWSLSEVLFPFFLNDITDSRKILANEMKISLWMKYKEFFNKLLTEKCQINAQIIQDIAKDLSYAVKTYNKHTYLTCLLFQCFDAAILKYHGYYEPFVPQKCHNI